MIEIIRDDGPLARKVWTFYPYASLGRATLRLREYSEQTRASKRHKFKPIRAYNMHLHPRCVGTVEHVTAPPLPADVMQEALQAMVAATVFIVRDKEIKL